MCEQHGQQAVEPKVKAKRVKWTPELAKELVESKGYEFLGMEGEWRGSVTKLKLRCPVDGHEWSRELFNIPRSRCSECSNKNRRKWTPELIKELAESRGYEYLGIDGEWGGWETRPKLRCPLDGHEWSPHLTSLKQGSGCPECGKRASGVEASKRNLKWTPELIKELVESRGYEYLGIDGEWDGIRTQLRLRCPHDANEWESSVSILSQGSGCPKCGKRSMALKTTKWTPELIKELAESRGYEYLGIDGEWHGIKTQLRLRCSKEGCSWRTTVEGLLRNDCPCRADCGYNPAKTGYLYVLLSDCLSMVKVGISNNDTKRHATLTRETPFDFVVLESLKCADGQLVADLEKEIHRATQQVKFNDKFDGYTEWRVWDDTLLPALIADAKTRITEANRAANL